MINEQTANSKRTIDSTKFLAKTSSLANIPRTRQEKQKIVFDL